MKCCRCGDGAFTYVGADQTYRAMVECSTACPYAERGREALYPETFQCAPGTAGRGIHLGCGEDCRDSSSRTVVERR